MNIFRRNDKDRRNSECFLRKVSSSGTLYLLFSTGTIYGTFVRNTTICSIPWTSKSKRLSRKETWKNDLICFFLKFPIWTWKKKVFCANVLTGKRQFFCGSTNTWWMFEKFVSLRAPQKIRRRVCQLLFQREPCLPLIKLIFFVKQSDTWKKTFIVKCKKALFLKKNFASVRLHLGLPPKSEVVEEFNKNFSDNSYWERAETMLILDVKNSHSSSWYWSSGSEFVQLIRDTGRISSQILQTLFI